MSREEIYNSRVTFQGKFDYRRFYSDLKKYLENKGWVGYFGKNYYELYYYHKITYDGSLLIRFIWKMSKEFWKEEPKITWYLSLDTWISGYNPTTNSGRIDISISGEHEIEEFREPEVKTTFEKIFAYFIPIGKMKENLEKLRVKGPKLPNKSAEKLYGACEDLRKWISDYLGAYY